MVLACLSEGREISRKKSRKTIPKITHGCRLGQFPSISALHTTPFLDASASNGCHEPVNGPERMALTSYPVFPLPHPLRPHDLPPRNINMCSKIGKLMM